jgi:hypothetical protein
MDSRSENSLTLFLELSSNLRNRIQAIRERKLADSLFCAFLDAELAAFDQSFHTLSEAIEDGETL